MTVFKIIDENQEVKDPPESLFDIYLKVRQQAWADGELEEEKQEYRTPGAPLDLDVEEEQKIVKKLKTEVVFRRFKKLDEIDPAAYEYWNDKIVEIHKANWLDNLDDKDAREKVKENLYERLEWWLDTVHPETAPEWQPSYDDASTVTVFSSLSMDSGMDKNEDWIVDLVLDAAQDWHTKAQRELAAKLDKPVYLRVGFRGNFPISPLKYDHVSLLDATFYWLR